MTGFHWRTTERGFLVGEFSDATNVPASIREQGGSRVSLGTDESPAERVFLSREQAAQIGALLTAFAASGDLRTAVELLALGVSKGAE